MNINIVAIKILQDNYVWLLINQTQQTCLIVDPGDAEKVLDFLKKYNLSAIGILITHHHNDHTAGIPLLLKNYSIPVYGHYASKVQGITHFLHGSEKINIAEWKITISVIEVPGHTLDHVAFLYKNHLFCGDTLFSAGCGRVFEGSYAQMYHSLQKLASLPQNTKIYCTHEYTLNNVKFALTLEPENQDLKMYWDALKKRQINPQSIPTELNKELKINPFLRCENRNFLNALKQKYPELQCNAPIEVFSHIRQLKDRF